MFTTNVPLVMLGESDPLVLRLRTVLNIPGGDTLDRPLSEMLRGIQYSSGLTAHGHIDEPTLARLDMLDY